MEITYSLEQKDLSHFQDYCLTGNTKSGKLKVYAWIVGLLVLNGFSFALKIGHSGHPSVNIHALLVSSGSFFGLVLALFLLFMWLQKREKKATPVVLQTQTLRLTEYGLSIHSVIDNTTVSWANLFQIEEDPTHLYFLLSKNRGYIVPKRVFPDVSEERRFYDQAIAWRSQSLQNPLNIPGKSASSGPKSQRQVRYTLSEADVAHGVKFLARQTKSNNIIRFPLIALGCVLLVSMPTLLSTRHMSSKQMSELLISVILPVVIIGGFLIYLYYHGNTKAMLTNIPELKAQQTVTFDTERIVFASTVAETVGQWEKLADVATDNRMIYFFTPERQAYMVPYHAFATLDDAREFYDLAHKCWENAKAGTPLTELPQTESWPPPPVL